MDVAAAKSWWSPPRDRANIQPAIAASSNTKHQ